MEVSKIGKNRYELSVILGIFGIIATAMVYLMFDGGLIPIEYLGDFTLTQLCSLLLILFSVLAVIMGVLD